MKGSIYSSTVDISREDLEPLNDRNSSESTSDSPRKHETTNFQTFLHILKGNVGPGILALPLAIRNGGWVFGPIALLIVASMAIHCMQLLVSASRHFCNVKNKKSMDYGEVAESALHMYGSVSMRTYASVGASIVNMFVIIAQFGFCCTYFIFISRNLEQFIHDYGSQYFIEFTDMAIAPTIITICLAFPICMICTIRNLDNLSFWSLLANVASMFSLGVIYYFLFSTMASNWAEADPLVTEQNFTEIASSNGTSSLPMIQDFGHITLFFGAAIFAFEGITVVLPLENSMKNPSHFSKVLKFAMSIVTFLFFTMGLCGYLAVGDQVEASITLSLPNTGERFGTAFLYSMVKLSYSFVVFISFALQFYVPVSFLWPWISDNWLNRYKGTRSMVYLELCFRYALVWILCFISVIVPHLDDFIALVGAFACSALSLIFPPIMDELIHTDLRRPRFISIKNYGISIFGVFGMILGTYFAMVQLITDLNHDFHSAELLINGTLS